MLSKFYFNTIWRVLLDPLVIINEQGMVSIDQEQFEALAQTKTAWFLQKNSKRGTCHSAS